jgi:hypothetical protein
MRRHTCRGVCVPSGTKNSKNDVDLVNSSGKSPGECVVLHQFIVPHFDIFIQNEMNMLRGYAVAAACLAATVATAAAFTAGGEWLWTSDCCIAHLGGVSLSFSLPSFLDCSRAHIFDNFKIPDAYEFGGRSGLLWNLSSIADSGNMIFLSR